MPGSNNISQFLSRFRRRLLLRLLLHTLLWSLLIGGVIALAYSITWRLQGRAVPTDFFLFILFWIAFLTALWALLRNLSSSEAAQAADREYGLKDGLTSFLRFDQEERTGEVYQLQSRQVASQIQDHSPETLPLKLPWKVLAGTTALLAVVFWLATLPNSAAVEQQLQQEQLILDKTTEVKTQLTELMDELLKELDEDELAEANVEEMKEWVKGLQETKDQKEALRQLARFEQKIAQTLKGLEATQDEQTLKLAAAELAKSELSNARQIGKKLEKNEFKEAAQNLKTLKPSDRDPKASKLTPEERKEMMKKLRETTKRMAQGAKNQNQPKQNLQEPIDPQEMVPLDQLLDELDQAAQEFDPQQEQDQQEQQDGQQAGQPQDNRENGLEKDELDEKMQKFGDRMKKLDARNRLRGKLRQMRQQVSQSQSFAAGQSQQLSLRKSKGKGGLLPGQGSQKSNRDQQTEIPEQMNVERLTGQKGEGDSQTAVEDADSGTGISGKRASANARDFSRQMESFVQRDDIPEEMKLGVREYFERVHEVEPQKTQEPQNP